MESDVRDFYYNVMAVLEGREESLIRLSEVMRVMKLMEAIHRSAETGEVVAPVQDHAAAMLLLLPPVPGDAPGTMDSGFDAEQLSQLSLFQYLLHRQVIFVPASERHHRFGGGGHQQFRLPSQVVRDGGGRHGRHRGLGPEREDRAVDLVYPVQFGQCESVQ